VATQQIWRLVILLTLFCLPVTSVAEEEQALYYQVSIAKLEIVGVQVESEDLKFFPGSPRGPTEKLMWPYVVLDGKGKAFVSGVSASSILHVHSLQAGDVTGTLIWPSQDWSGMKKHRFRIPEELGREKIAHAFYRAEHYHYQRLAESDVAGSFWFKHRLRQVEKVLGYNQAVVQVADTRRFVPADRLLSLFSGRRAIDLSLDLTTELNAGDEDAAEGIPISALRGITIEGIDWSNYLNEEMPTLDLLAEHVPQDHLVVFFPSLEQAWNVLQTSNEFVRPLSWSTRSETEDPRFVPKYLEQLRLPIDQWVGTEMADAIDEVAVVSSDPYWQEGTEVAVLFSCHEGPGYGIWSRMIHGLVRDDSSIVFAQLARNRFMVSNSQRLFQQIKEIGDNSLAELEEYRFFRQRYRKDTEHESAFVVCTDAAIRKWCSPVWRIGQSRRRQAAAMMAALQSEFIDGVSTQAEFRHELLGRVTFPEGKIHSRRFGTLAFMRPIAQLQMEDQNASVAEVRAYDQWRRSYETGWQRFDPIAIQMALRENQIVSDLTVMPLHSRTQYRRWMPYDLQWTLSPSDGDQHPEAIVHAMMPARAVWPIWYLDRAEFIEVFLDQSPVWKELSNAKDPAAFAKSIDYRFPLAIGVKFQETSDATQFHDQIMSITGNANRWTPQEYRQVPLHHLPIERESFFPLDIYLLCHNGRVVVVLKEETMHQIIDRILDQKDKPEPSDWSGKHIGLKITSEAMEILATINSLPVVQRIQERSWSNLPILNEWKQMYPDQDPVEVHERLWATKLVCPAGGQYVWNEQWQTIESTATGHPAQPKFPETTAHLLPEFQSLDAGITFEAEGLRGRSVLRLVPKN